MGQQINSDEVSDREEEETDLALADDEEGVSSRSLSDDVIAILIVCLSTEESV